MLDDAALLTRFYQGGSDEAFAELVSRHLNFVYSTALRQVAGDTHLAEDVAQSVFADLARKAKEISKCPVLGRWLYTSTHHAAANAVRSEQRRRARETIAQAMHDVSNDQANDAEWARIRPWIDVALRGLSRQDSDAILLRFFEARSFAEIGSQLGLNENAARMRVERALEKLRTILFRRGITSSTVAIAMVLSNEALIAAPAGLAMAITKSSLASAASGGAATTTLLEVMSTTKLGVGIAAALLVAAVYLSDYEIRSANDAVAALTSARLQCDAEFRQLQELRTQVGAADRSRVELEKSIANLEARRTSSAVMPESLAGAKRSSPSAPESSIKPTTATDPKLRNDLEVWFKGLAAVQFGPFFKSAGFSPEQQELMLNLLSQEKTLALGNVVTSLRPEAVSSDQVRQVIQDFLGTVSAQQQYQEFVRTSDLRPVSAVLAANLASTGTPLSYEQGEQLNQILANNCPPGQSPSPLEVNWEDALAQAQTVLSAQQLAMLRDEADLVVSAGGITGTAFHPAGTFGGWGEDAPSFPSIPSSTGK